MADSDDPARVHAIGHYRTRLFWGVLLSGGPIGFYFFGPWFLSLCGLQYSTIGGVKVLVLLAPFFFFGVVEIGEGISGLVRVHNGDE